MKLGIFSISYAGLWGQVALGLPQFLRHAGELGFETVMIAGKRPHLLPLDVDENHISAIKSELATSNIRCNVIAAYVDFGALVACEVPVVEMQIAYCESLCRIGAQLEARWLRVFTAYEPEGANHTLIWQRTVEALRETCDRAKQFGMSVAIQNHHDLAVHTSALLELLSDIDRPNCRLGFDAWSPALRGENLYDAARQAAPHVGITTNADYIRTPRFRYRPEVTNYELLVPEMVRAVPFGAGFIDYGAFFEGLRAGGFDGPAIYEVCSPIRGGGSLENLDRCSRGYIEWMREHKLA